MDKYLKYCGDAETRELTGKGNTIYNDDDADDDNNINAQDYYGVVRRRQEKIAMYAKQTQIIRDSAENLCEACVSFVRRYVKHSEIYSCARNVRRCKCLDTFFDECRRSCQRCRCLRA